MLGFLVNLVFFILYFQLSHSATVVVDDVSEWKNPTVQIGDSHKYHYNLYIFKNQESFNLCNFTHAILLSSKSNSTSYIWHPSRTGFFYFSFNNGTNKSCQEGQKLAVKVTLFPPPENQASSPPDHMTQMALPPQSSGGIFASALAFPWPFRPREETNSPSHAPSLILPATSPMIPEKSGIPFINSNPDVPLPTGEVDSATNRPFSISGSHEERKV